VNRSILLSHFHGHGITPWDILIIGGGATGAGIAVDAASRGFDTLLLEQDDFGKGTSSRSTKLIHGGVRYLAQGDLVLVIEALKERGIILKNAPHLTSNQEFVIPVYSWWDAVKFTLGLKFYDILAGRLSLGKSTFINRKETMLRLPLLVSSGLKGGIVYHDGQFDDARLLIALIRTAIEQGGIALNYFKVIRLLKNNHGVIAGVVAVDVNTGKEYDIKARVVVNATGVFADHITRMDNPLIKRSIRPSQGIHIVLDQKFLKGKSALMIPKTDDGRVLFAIPWYDRVVLGTTDTPVEMISKEPRPLESEIDFILKTAGKYLKLQPERKDILSIFAGLRPLVANPDTPTVTREISRRHKISISHSGLVIVEGGKWTIYRRMAKDTIDEIIKAGMLAQRACVTHTLKLYGYINDPPPMDRLSIYGKHAREIRELSVSDNGEEKPMHPGLPYTRAEIIWICRNEMPGKIEDILARRTRALLLDAKSSKEIARETAAIMASELGFSKQWENEQVKEYNALVENYLCDPPWLPSRNK
jgi:glycerol-3-phosphate dehydrogenase